MANSWVTQLHERRNRAIKEATDLLERRTEGEFTPEDKDQFNRLAERAEELNETLEGAKKLERMAAEGDAIAEVVSEAKGLVSTGEAAGITEPPDHSGQLKRLASTRGRSEPVKLRFDNYMEWRRQVSQGATARDLLERNVSIGGSGAGAATVTIPTTVESRFFDVLLNINGVRKAGAEVWTTAMGNPMTLPKATDLETVPPTAANITGEAATITETEPTFSVVTLNPVKVAGLVTLTREVLQDPAPNIESLIGDRLGRQIGWRTEFLYNLGTGSSQPKGIFHSPPAAQTTTTATKGSITYAEMLNVKFAIDDYPMSGGGMGNCWAMRKGTFGHILGITGASTGNDHPIFTMGGAPEIPDMILGDRVVYNNFAGVVDTANAYLICYGDFFNGYIIRDVGTVEIDYDESVNFKTDETVFRAILRTDGKFINQHLFSWLREKAS